MAVSFQQQSLRRKVAYFIVIVVLFTLTLLIRRWDVYGIEAQGTALEIREESLGEVDLTSSVLRLILSGSRGAVVCYVWNDAMDKQKRHEWNQLDQRVGLLVKLQPHFIVPWQFQSWNLAYNVSVEFDRVKDKYFFIARGIQLLAEGERKNKDNPDLRFYIGNYTQSKMGISDENNTLRSLYQMSCIDPAERNPARFLDDKKEVKLTEFEDFCREHPVLVRRLRDSLRYRTPEEIVEFLAANYKIPCLFEQEASETGRQFKALADRFPVLPPPSRFGGPGELTYDSPLRDDFDSYAAARAWYSYAQDPLDDPVRPRRNRYMAQIIFRGYPARAQSYLAQRREKEGWFDRDGWQIKGWFPENPREPQGPKKVVAVGTGRNWAMDEWERAHQMYKDHGERHGLYKTPEEVRALTPEQLRDYNYNRHLSNFDHFYFESQVEKSREAVTARKRFFQAHEFRMAGEPGAALDEYEKEDALGHPSTWWRDSTGKFTHLTGWKKLLLDHPEFRKDSEVEEESYIIERRYLRLVRERRLPYIRQYLLLQDFLTQRALAPVSAGWLPIPVHLLPSVPLPFPSDLPPFKGPFEDVDDEDKPLISLDAKNRVLSRQRLPTLPTPTAPTTPAQPATPGKPTAPKATSASSQ
jgi:hypothetical protein